MAEQQNIPGILPPRVAITDKELVHRYHRMLGMINAVNVIKHTNVNLPGVKLAMEAVSSEMHQDRCVVMARANHFIAKQGLANQYCAVGYHMDGDELIVDLKSLEEIDTELATAKARTSNHD